MVSHTGTSSASKNKLLIGGAILVLVLGVATYEGYWVFQPKAKLTLTDITTYNAKSSCGTIFQNPQQIGAAFTIVNTGKADGFATVTMSGGGGILENNTYFVKAGQSANETLTTTVDCSENFMVSVWISQVQSS
jgi:hypothetical protein